MPATCEYFFCSEEVWAACTKCLCFLCYDHFLLNNSCSNHNVYHDLQNTNSNSQPSDIPYWASWSTVSQYQPSNLDRYDIVIYTFSRLAVIWVMCLSFFIVQLAWFTVSFHFAIWWMCPFVSWTWTCNISFFIVQLAWFTVSFHFVI